MRRIREAMTRYVRLLAGLRGGWVRDVKMPDDPVALSYFIGGILQVDLLEKQALLEETSAAKRLEAELTIMEREAPELKKRVAREFGQRRSAGQ